MTPTIVWFKRDLRLSDHAPLVGAVERGSVVPVYIYEPELLESPYFEESHLRFLNQALWELSRGLAELGAPLVIRRGEALAVLREVARESGARAMFSHEETGNAATYARDLRVAVWARAENIEWREFRQDGVVRRLRDRDGWSKRWDALMGQPLEPVPQRIVGVSGLGSAGLLNAQELTVAPSEKALVQEGGSAAARRTLEEFLHQRGRDYTSAMSSPVTGEDACSRISPYLAFGCLSVREASHAAHLRRVQLKEQPAPLDARPWRSAIKSFEARLHWHCHFMQKLETQPSIEFENIQRACDGLREDDFDEERFARWCAGETGFPMVDACMRYVRTTGWLNFRMRAMLVSFAAYDLWLHWRRPAVFLARHFLDYEPGIHYSQFQMQSGTTGINTLRIYSPTKQAIDQDPTGAFIRRWVLELEGVPLVRLFEPWKMSSAEQHAAGCVIGKRYPAPVVDHQAAVKFAKDRIYGMRRQAESRAEARGIVEKHGSRKRPSTHAAKPRRQPTKPETRDLFEG